MKYSKYVIWFASLTAFQIGILGHTFFPHYAAKAGLIWTICGLFYMAIEAEQERIEETKNK